MVWIIECTSAQVNALMIMLIFDFGLKLIKNLKQLSDFEISLFGLSGIKSSNPVFITLQKFYFGTLIFSWFYLEYILIHVLRISSGIWLKSLCYVIEIVLKFDTIVYKILLSKNYNQIFNFRMIKKIFYIDDHVYRKYWISIANISCKPCLTSIQNI